MNGVELFRRMRAQRPEIMGIFLTGFTTIDVVIPAIGAGILQVLPQARRLQRADAHLRAIRRRAGVRGRNG